MYAFSKKSKARLDTCHYMLQIVANEAMLLQVMDFSVVCGHRDKKDQMIAYQENRSKLVWPKSKHNKMPSEAMDLIPYPEGYTNIYKFYKLAGIILAVAKLNNIEITWGGDWKSFKDYPHFQIEV